MEATVSYLLKHVNKRLKQNTEIKDYALCSSNVSRDFTINNMKKKRGLKEVLKFFSVDFNSI